MWHKACSHRIPCFFKRTILGRARCHAIMAGLAKTSWLRVIWFYVHINNTFGLWWPSCLFSSVSLQWNCPFRLEYPLVTRYCASWLRLAWFLYTSYYDFGNLATFNNYHLDGSAEIIDFISWIVKRYFSKWYFSFSFCNQSCWQINQVLAIIFHKLSNFGLYSLSVFIHTLLNSLQFFIH